MDCTYGNSAWIGTAFDRHGIGEIFRMRCWNGYPDVILDRRVTKLATLIHYSLKFKIALTVSYLLVIGLPLSTAAAGTVEVPRFKTVDEAIGWVKAKGTCKDYRCRLRIELPDEVDSKKIKWNQWAWLSSTDIQHVPEVGDYRSFRVAIVRSRFAQLSAKDPTTRLRTVKSSEYTFQQNGKLSEVQVGFAIENAEGETLLEFLVPTESHKHGDGPGDLNLLRHHLGVSWNYLR